MNQSLKNFIEEIKNNEKLKNEFIKCENLKESYDKFMKGKCSYEEYEKFFKDLIKSATPLSDEDLEQVAGGFSLKQILAPITMATMLIGSGAIPAYAAPPNGSSINTTTNASNNMYSGKKQENNKDESTKYKIDGFVCEVAKGDKDNITIANPDPTAKVLYMSNIHAQLCEKLGYQPRFYNINNENITKVNADNITHVLGTKLNVNTSLNIEIAGFICEVTQGNATNEKHIKITNPDSTKKSLDMFTISQDLWNIFWGDHKFYTISGENIEKILIDQSINNIKIDEDCEADLEFKGELFLDNNGVHIDPKNKRYLEDEIGIWEKNDKNESEKLIRIFDSRARYFGQMFPYEIQRQKIQTENKPESSPFQGKIKLSVPSNEVININDIPDSLKLISKKYNIDFEILPSTGSKIIIPKDCDINFSINAMFSTVQIDLDSGPITLDIMHSLIEKDNTYFITIKGTDSENPVTLDLSKVEQAIRKIIKEGSNIKFSIDSNIKSINLDAQDVGIFGAENLETINLSQNNKKYKIVDGYLWTIDDKGELSENLGFISKKSIKESIINLGLEKIDDFPTLDKNEKEKYEDLINVDKHRKLEEYKKLKESGKELNPEQQKHFNELSSDLEKSESFSKNSGYLEKFQSFLELPDSNSLGEKQYTIYKPNENRTDKDEKSNKDITINEKEVYKQIQNVVKKLIEKVEKRTPPKEGISNTDLESGIQKKIYSKHHEMDKNWRIAKAIYRWVAKNISYDQDSLVRNCRKSQDPLFVFNQKMGVCEGYSLLTNLMMRMAGIPSSEIVTIREKDASNSVHAYSAIYLPDSEIENNDIEKNSEIIKTKKSGWVLFDVTWGSPNKNANQAKVNQLNEFQKHNLKEFFPGFYNKSTQLKDDNKEILQKTDHKISYVHTDNREYTLVDTTTLGIKPDVYGGDNFSKDNLIFTLNGSLQNPVIDVIPKKNQTVKDFQIKDIPQNLLKYNYPVIIGPNIKNLTLGKDDDVIIKILNTNNLESATIDKENKRYFANEDGIWEKDSKGKPKKLIHLFKKEGSFEDGDNTVKYSIKANIFDRYLVYVSLDSPNINMDKVPENLKLIGKQNGNYFSIENCSESFRLGKDDNWNLGFGENFKPKSITVDEGNPRYEMMGNELYDKKTEKVIYTIEKNE